jgi:hypothetical protein
MRRAGRPAPPSVVLAWIRKLGRRKLTLIGMGSVAEVAWMVDQESKRIRRERE